MESWKGMKRPWEDDNAVDLRHKRRGSTSVVVPSPLPLGAGCHPHDSQTVDQRRLPPLHTSIKNLPAESITSLSVHQHTAAESAAQSDHTKPRSQSIFNVLQQPHEPQHGHSTEHLITHHRTSESHTADPSLGSQVARPCSNTDLAVKCCTSNCQGRACSDVRALIHKLATQVALLSGKVKSITQTENRSSNPPVESETLDNKEALQQAFDLAQWSNFNLETFLSRHSSHSPERLSQLDETDMRRGQHYLEEREEQMPATRHNRLSQHGPSRAVTVPEDSRRYPYTSETISIGHSQHTISSPGSTWMAPHSPLQTPQAMRTTILPSPSSMNFPKPSTLPPMSPPSAAVNSSAQNAHLQDLQHQISVKTLAFQTLQREYDSLLQKLERQRTKCATLEKKFEVSDIEINSLTDEREKSQAHVAALETQVEDLQRSRDEVRRELVANGAQYVRIMEMANRLQAQGAEDKKKWDLERTELEQRIRLLEDAMVAGSPSTNPPDDTSNIKSCTTSTTTTSDSPSQPQIQTITLLRAEITRLRSRTQSLQSALQTMRHESLSMQNAAKQLVESSGRMEDAAHGVLGESS